MIAGMTYMAYKFVRSWLLPKFFDIADPVEEERRELHNQLNELQNTTKVVMDSVSQCSYTVSAQQEQLDRALTFISNNGRGTCLNNCLKGRLLSLSACLTMLSGDKHEIGPFKLIPPSGFRSGRAYQFGGS